MDLTRTDSGRPVWLCTDWAALWRDLVTRQAWGAWTGPGDPWEGRAEEYGEREARRWSQRDPIRDFVAARIRPGSTVLDIGAGTGSWARMLARTASRVTAIDPSPAMRTVMRAGLEVAGTANVDLRPGRWPEVDTEAHDYTLCSHAMYASADFPAFVQRMIEVTHRTCFLVLRVTATDGIMTEAARHVWGHPMGSPNFTIAYNILLQMGLTPNVLMNTRMWEPTTSTTLDAALATVKGHFRITTPEHDRYLTSLLRRRLLPRDGQYTWPAELRSALVYWDVG